MINSMYENQYDEIHAQVDATFGREFLEIVNTAIATVNAGSNKQSRESALRELYGIHMLDLSAWVVNALTNAYMTPGEEWKS